MLPLPGLHVTEDDAGLAVFAISAKGHSILDLTLDESATVTVSPDYYGVSPDQARFMQKLNDVLTSATEAALDAGCLAVQEALQIETGGVAEMHFSAVAQRAPVREALANYILSESNFAMKG